MLTYDRMRRYEGAWHTEKREVFPGCVFLESENEKQLLRELKQKGLEDMAGSLAALEVQEENLLKSLCTSGHHLEMSRGYILDGQTHVLEGPLRGMESWIRRIDRHKRLARLEISGGLMSDRPVCLGLEIVEKQVSQS